MRRKWYAEDVSDLAIEVRHAALRMVDRAHDHVPQAAKTLRHEAQRHALAGPRLARDHHEAAVAHGGLHPTREGVHLGDLVERLDRDVGTEWMKLQTIELQ